MGVTMAGCRSVSFTEKTRSTANVVRYFRTWASYELPFRPVGEISKEEAKELSEKYAYYEARYDATGKLVRLLKHFNGTTVNRVEYFYDSDDYIVKCKSTNPSDLNSGVTEWHFNKSGTLIKFRKRDSQGHILDEQTISDGKNKNK